MTIQAKTQLNRLCFYIPFSRESNEKGFIDNILTFSKSGCAGLSR